MDLIEEQECIENGTPDSNGIYHFIGTITHTMFSSESFKDSRLTFGVYKFTTNTPLPKLGLNKFTKKMEGTISGNTIELIPMKTYRFNATLVFNEKYQDYQYNIKGVFETEQLMDNYDKYLKFFCTDKQYEAIKNKYPNFAKDVLEDLSFNPERPKYVPTKSLNKIIRNIKEYKDYLPLIVRLGQFPEFTLNSIVNMASFSDEENSLGDSPAIILKKIEDDPYCLMNLKGFGWKKVDKLALALKPESISSESRLISFCKFALENITEDFDGGHTWIFINNPNDIKHSMAHLIRDNVPECSSFVKDYFNQEKLLTKQFGCGSMFYVDDDRIGLAVNYRSERKILSNLIRINNGPHLVPSNTLDNAIIATNRYMSEKAGEPLQLTEEQIDLIKATLDNDVVILTAHAGAGKSTAIKGVVELWGDKSIACCALAAKAAIRIQETSGMESHTIHRLLGFGKEGFKYNENNPLAYDIIIVDECSMINTSLFLSLVKAIKSSGKIILVFDDAQLPSIGAGSVAKDLLTSNFCIKRLTKIHRQAAKSGIKLDANSIRQQLDIFRINNDYDIKGNLPQYVVHGEKKDAHYFCLQKPEDIHLQTMLIYKGLIEGGGLAGKEPIAVEDITVIVPMKSRGDNCTDTFNQEIQELVLPNEEKRIVNGTYQDKNKNSRVFKLGARVIRKQNDYDKMVFNGEQGTIINITDDCEYFEVQFDDDNRVVTFKDSELAYFDLAYALTVHSMQGSENKVIIFVMDINHKVLLDSTLFYTAITRARDLNIVVFQPSAYITAYTENKVTSRQTFLPLLINNISEEDKSENESEPKMIQENNTDKYLSEEPEYEIYDDGGFDF